VLRLKRAAIRDSRLELRCSAASAAAAADASDPEAPDDAGFTSVLVPDESSAPTAGDAILSCDLSSSN
jgi:hypothetical protein